MVDASKAYKPVEAFDLVKKAATAKFTETVDVAVKLNYAPKKGDSVRSSVSLPHGSGKKVKIAVLTSPSKIKEAEEAGADVVGSEDLIEKIQGGFMDFDVLLASPDMMPKVARLGKILGTKGLMPNPKSGTVSPEIGKTVKEFKAGKVEFRMDAGGVIHLVLGKVDFDSKKLADNLKTVLETIRKVKPSSIKGSLVKSITVSSSMGPGVKIDHREFTEILQ